VLSAWSPRFGGDWAAGAVQGRAVGVLLPHTWMNASGEAVAEALSALDCVDPASGLLVAYDDLDLPLSRLRLRARGGAGGHRGMASVLDAVGDDRIARLRFGVGRPPHGREPRTYVLEPFEAAEQPILAEGIARAVDAAECFLAEGIAAAMDRYNAAPPAGDTRPEEG